MLTKINSLVVNTFECWIASDYTNYLNICLSTKFSVWGICLHNTNVSSTLIEFHLHSPPNLVLTKRTKFQEESTSLYIVSFPCREMSP